MTSHKGSSGKQAAAFAAIYLLWGSNFLAIRYAAEAIPPFLMMGARSLTAGALLFAWAYARHGARPSPGHWRSALAVGTVLFVGCHGLLAWAETTVASGVAALVLATIPVWLALLDWGTGGARPNSRVVAGLALGLSGLVVLVGPKPGADVPLPGLVALLVSAFAWAAGSILSRHLPHPKSLVLTSGMQLLCGGAVLVVAGVALGELDRIEGGTWPPRALVAFAYMVVAASLIGFTAYMWLLRVSTPARVGTYAFVNPVVALFVGWAVGGELIEARTLGASFVIVVGVALVVTATWNGRGASGLDRRPVAANVRYGLRRLPPRSAAVEGPEVITKEGER